MPKKASDFRGKLAIAGVSFLGTLGLALSILYLVAVGLNFVPGFSKLSQFMIGTQDELSYGFLVLVFPYALVMAHLYLRSQLGHWLYDQQYYGLAFKFCAKRRAHNWFRSKAEALANQSILLALNIRDENWKDAITLYKSIDAHKKNPFFWRWLGWVAELHHRLDDKEALSALFQQGEETGKLGTRYLAIFAQYSIENGEIEKGMVLLEKAKWKGENPRALLVETAQASNHEADPKVALIWERYIQDIPSASIEAALAMGRAVDTFKGDPRSLRLLNATAVQIPPRGEEE